jgi:hypothetical protein
LQPGPLYLQEATKAALGYNETNYPVPREAENLGNENKISNVYCLGKDFQRWHESKNKLL